MTVARRRVLLALALAGACGVDAGGAVGAPCEQDDDCEDGFFCGADDRASADRTRICVPEAECDPARFGAACAGEGLYSCVDDQVTWTSCEPGWCEDGSCVE
ncbi:MAG: hypothetical protein A2138_15200 [Deltaproteobacteria bacterium RBG_16_71_12]|nr:MAG: hypothetical protein A2138_15200 [Deltaproteobacteria bacterium RBG_16_71_12]